MKKRVALSAVQCPELILVITSQVAGSSFGQRCVGTVDEVHHLLHLIPLCETQSDTPARWLDFGLAIRHIELAKINALESRGDRHITSTADMLSIVDLRIILAGVLNYFVHFGIDFVEVAGNCLSTTTCVGTWITWRLYRSDAFELLLLTSSKSLMKRGVVTFFREPQSDTVVHKKEDFAQTIRLCPCVGAYSLQNFLGNDSPFGTFESAKVRPNQASTQPKSALLADWVTMCQ